MSQVRANPTESAPLIQILRPDGRSYTGTDMYHGWVKLSELNGWIKSSDIYVLETIEPFNPDKHIDFNAPVDPNSSGIDGDDIVHAISRSRTPILTNKIQHITNDNEHGENLGTLVDGFIRSSNANLDVLAKLEDIPLLPPMPDNAEYDGAVMIYRAKDDGTIEWGKISYSDLIDTPDANSLMGPQKF